jgi:hypothetical protein
VAVSQENDIHAIKLVIFRIGGIPLDPWVHQHHFAAREAKGERRMPKPGDFDHLSILTLGIGATTKSGTTS